MSHHSGGGSEGNKGPRYSKRAFAGARRYRFFNRRGEVCYLYGESMPEKISPSFMIFQCLFCCILLLGGSALMLPFIFEQFSPQQALVPTYEAPQKHIEDSWGVVDNEAQLEQTMKEFEELTGICPYVVTCRDSDWQDRNDDLADYASAYYEYQFLDKQHFLIIYSEPDNAASADVVEWSWAGVQGNDTNSIITNSHFRSFQDDLQSNLMNDDVSVGAAFDTAFRNSLKYMMVYEGMDWMRWRAILLIGGFLLFWIAVMVHALVGIIKRFIIGRREYEEVGC